ncbi:MAG: hypothetical protein HPY74_11770 [Firmicutes bacterium]|nr:hypothetical protein [Bacillota bacterium]
MKWKIIAIIIAVLLVIGIAGKFAIDRLFSLIFLSRVADIGLDLKSALSSTLADNGNILSINENEGLTTGGDDKELSENGHNISENGNGEEKENIPGKGITENKDAVVQNNGEEREIQGEEEGVGETEVKEEVQGEKETREKDESQKTGEEVKAGNDEEIKDIVKKDIVINDTNMSIQDKKVPGDTPENTMFEEARDGTINLDNNTSDNNTSDNNTGDNNTNDSSSDSTINNTGGNADKDNNNGEDPDTISVTKEKIEKAEKEVSTIDKLRALDIIFRKLKPSDIEILIGMLRKGKLTQDEINTAKSIIKERVTEEEKEVLKELFNKYEYLIE